MGEEFERPALDPWLIVMIERPEEAEGYMPPPEESDSVHYEVARTGFVVLEEEVSKVLAIRSPEVGEIEERSGDDGIAEVYDAGNGAGGWVEEDVVAGEV